MSVAGLSNSGAMPVLEAMIRFSGQRQGIIQNNIANISTPRYQQRDVDVAQIHPVWVVENQVHSFTE